MAISSLLFIVLFVIVCSGETANGSFPIIKIGEKTEDPLKTTRHSSGISLGGDSVIDSGGKKYPSSSQRDVKTGGGPKYSPPSQSPASENQYTWLGYTNNIFHFSINYPELYIILPESAPLPIATARMVHRVRFQDRQRASGQFADREPAQFTIEVFELEAPVPLRDWLQSTGLASTRAIVERAKLDGAIEGWLVRLPMLMAPNRFYYFSTKKYVYRLTPLGPYSQKMLASFQLSSNE